MTEKGADMFQQDNAFIVFLNKLADMVILSVLFCLCCLPVFTIGAADAALYHTVVKVLRHDSKNFPVSFVVTDPKGYNIPR